MRLSNRNFVITLRNGYPISLIEGPFRYDFVAGSSPVCGIFFWERCNRPFKSNSSEVLGLLRCCAIALPSGRATEDTTPRFLQVLCNYRRNFELCWGQFQSCMHGVSCWTAEHSGCHRYRSLEFCTLHHRHHQHHSISECFNCNGYKALRLGMNNGFITVYFLY